MNKKSVSRQIAGVFFTHILMSLMMFFILMGILALTDNFALKVIVSILAAVIYAFIMFSKSYECAVDDLKSYSVIRPYAFKGVTLASAIVIVIIALWIIYAVSWKVMPVTEDNISPLTVGANALYMFMTAPFLAMVDIKGPECNLWGQIISAAVPLASCILGYYAGYKKWDYIKYINKFVYETKNKRK